jgi:hypothetical protein
MRAAIHARRHLLLKGLVTFAIVVLFVGLGVGPRADQEVEGAGPGVASHHHSPRE